MPGISSAKEDVLPGLFEQSRDLELTGWYYGAIGTTGNSGEARKLKFPCQNTVNSILILMIIGGDLE